jgi:23S rRNA U2552 (ribose-2'-O)-methylase RlmE/FtsJ
MPSPPPTEQHWTACLDRLRLPVAVAVDLDADRGEWLQAAVDRDSGPGRLVGSIAITTAQWV